MILVQRQNVSLKETKGRHLLHHFSSCVGKLSKFPKISGGDCFSGNPTGGARPVGLWLKQPVIILVRYSA